jgi:hypothetical protein
MKEDRDGVCRFRFCRFTETGAGAPEVTIGGGDAPPFCIPRAADDVSEGCGLSLPEIPLLLRERRY